jgi:hypothetical protein
MLEVGRTITPDQVKRVDFEQMESQKCCWERKH